MNIMKIFFDSEFIDDGRNLLLISLGAVSENGDIFYAESNEFDAELADPWVHRNVLNQVGQMPAQSNKQIADNFENYVHKCTRMGLDIPIFYGWFADYDWVLLTKLYGGMLKVPSGWPQLCLDVKQEAIRLENPRLPMQSTRKHHALNDAIWTKEAFDFLGNYEKNLEARNGWQRI